MSFSHFSDWSDGNVVPINYLIQNLIKLTIKLSETPRCVPEEADSICSTEMGWGKDE